MNFDVYFKFKGRDGSWKPGTHCKPYSLSAILALCQNDDELRDAAFRFRAGDKEAKKELPAVDWIGRSKTGKRLADDCEPTQFVMIDLDHIDGNVREVWDEISVKIQANDEAWPNVLIAHVTPSMHGLRIVFKAFGEETTIVEQMDKFRRMFGLDKYGDFDSVVKDFSRLSFLVPRIDILYVNTELMQAESVEGPIVATGSEAPEVKTTSVPKDQSLLPVWTEDEVAEFDNFDYKGTLLKVIVDKWVETHGQPGSGEIHNYYNEMVKNFRNITSNNKRLLLYALPRFGHSLEECWSQIKSICKVNSLSRLPKDFYFWLKDNGYYKPRELSNNALKEAMLNDDEEHVEQPPYLPPVFREIVGTAPKDFVLPTVNALLPIMGTLTSYVRSIYPFDQREHSTSFFSVIYAPPGTGKGFVERFLDLLLDELKWRDHVQSERENVYLRAMQKKSQTERSPDRPHTSTRIMPAKNSEAEFLEKQQDNDGYHMFTYAAEMDAWAKGSRAAGGNKDDMIRIAWDNGEYGQSFKSSNTFKGMVRLYWNVLICGTLDQLERYFKNVENGLVTRCSFTSIDNQEFASAPVWRNITKRGMKVIKDFMARCDRNTYAEPCTVSMGDLQMTSDESFDVDIQWRFKFRPKKKIDMSWLMPEIESFLEDQRNLAARDIDKARDAFRRRVAVRGFRLGMICYCLWENPRISDLQKCRPFIRWWMENDLKSILKLWGSRYNELTDTVGKVVQRTVFDNLENEFTRTDVYTVCVKQGIKSPIRKILFDWRKLGYVTQIDKENYKKTPNYQKK